MEPAGTESDPALEDGSEVNDTIKIEPQKNSDSNLNSLEGEAKEPIYSTKEETEAFNTWFYKESCKKYPKKSKQRTKVSSASTDSALFDMTSTMEDLFYPAISCKLENVDKDIKISRDWHDKFGEGATVLVSNVLYFVV